MKSSTDIRCRFRVVPGRGAASGTREYAHVGGSIRAQIPHFERLGLSLKTFHPATINADISPATWQMVDPVFVARNVKWLPGHPGESFDFATAAVEFDGLIVPALVYYPRPETKLHANPAADTMMELLAPFISGLGYGSTGRVFLASGQIRIGRAGGKRQAPRRPAPPRALSAGGSG